MPRITDKKQEENLNRLGLEIRTKYRDGDRYVVKSTEEKNNDIQNIENGIVLEKIYLKRGVPLKKLNQFDSGILYRFITAEDEKKEISCPNCGFQARGQDFVDGCPYCGTIYNMEYKDKKLGTKDYYNLVLRSDHYLKITFLVDIVFCLAVMYLYIRVTGRTFNSYDRIKVLVGGILGGLLMFAVFYVVDAFFITFPVKYLKERKNRQQQLFWEKMEQKGLQKKRIYHQYHCELRNRIYADPNNIDYDIMDEPEFRETDVSENAVSITALVRIVSFQNNSIIVKKKKTTLVLTKMEEEKTRLKEGINIIACPGCGASVSAEDLFCSYCGRKTGNLT